MTLTNFGPDCRRGIAAVGDAREHRIVVAASAERARVVSGRGAELRSDLALVLVDYDNFIPPNTRGLGPDLVVHEIVSIIRLMRQRYSSIEEFRVRLYGGWYSDGTLSVAGSHVAQAIPPGAVFPMVDHGDGTIIRGEVELVDSLLAAPHLRFLETYRRRAGLPRIRLATSDSNVAGCTQSDGGCPVVALRRFSRKKSSTCPIEGCRVTSDQAFVVHEQKMVDTLLVCDLLEGVRSAVGAIAAVTSDSDLLPALTAATTAVEGRLLVIGSRSLWADEHVAMLRSLGADLQLQGAS